jgi:hypothetical protein
MVKILASKDVDFQHSLEGLKEALKDSKSRVIDLLEQYKTGFQLETLIINEKNILKIFKNNWKILNERFVVYNLKISYCYTFFH